MLDRTCKRCGKQFQVRPFEVKRGRGNLCSLSCAAAASAISRRSYRLEMNPRWAGENVVKSTIYRRRYVERHPERVAAHMEIRNAIRRGDIKRMPCSICGDAKSHAHHDDYAKPLEVIWLCRKHHDEVHQKLQ